MLKPLLDHCSIIRVQTWDPEGLAPATIDEALGIAWPQETGTVASGRTDILCIGPTDWLVIGSDPDAAALLQLLNQAFERSAFRATNVSSALTRLEVAGPNARMLLSKACSLDLYPRSFPPGRCARTRFAGMPVIVRCTRAATFECIVTMSYAEYLVSWLEEAATEFSSGQT